MGFPCVGSWVTYGLGSESQNLPAFVVMYDTLGRGLPKGHAQNWGAGFLPSVFQGTALKPQGAPIDNLNRPEDLTDAPAAGAARPAGAAQQARSWSSARRGRSWRPAIESFELAYRMQMAAPEALDVDQRDRETIQKLYGLDNPKCTHFAQQCLIARRLVERGVRFVQIYSGGMENERSWDGHTNIAGNHARLRRRDRHADRRPADRPRSSAACSTRRWSSGAASSAACRSCRRAAPAATTTRTPSPPGWPAAASRAASTTAQTDEIGHKAVEDRVSVNDLHATILHLLGLDHERLTYRYNGRDFRLTDVAGKVVESVLA